jgi:hypothetical protein
MFARWGASRIKFGKDKGKKATDNILPVRYYFSFYNLPAIFNV